MTEGEHREAIVHVSRQMISGGLVKGTSGNVSSRELGADRFLITPSGVDYGTMRPEDIVLLDLSGRPPAAGLKPSVDAPIHAAVYRARPDVGACIHTHSPYAAAFSSLGRDIPPLITESAGYLGGSVRTMEYVPPARTDTGDLVVAGLGGARAVLLPNHGVVAVGEDLRKCFAAAMAVEESAQIAFIALQLGTPAPVPEPEIARMHEFIHHRYGQR